jgi:hypothetical protein
MAKARSPEYPAISLKEAIDRVKMVYDKDYQNRVPRKVVAEHMGYKGLSGASLPILSALIKYGLLEGRGDDTRVSDLAVQILAHERGTPERMQGLWQASKLPELFADINKRFPDGKASDSAIRSYLLTSKFIPGAADAAIRAYRDTKSLVDGEAAGYIESDGPPSEGASNLSPETAELLDRPSNSFKRPSMMQEKFDLEEGTVTISVPSVLSAESYQDFADRMQILLRGLKRRSDAEEALKE